MTAASDALVQDIARLFVNHPPSAWRPVLDQLAQGGEVQSRIGDAVKRLLEETARMRGTSYTAPERIWHRAKARIEDAAAVQAGPRAAILARLETTLNEHALLGTSKELRRAWSMTGAEQPLPPDRRTAVQAFIERLAQLPDDRFEAVLDGIASPDRFGIASPYAQWFNLIRPSAPDTKPSLSAWVTQSMEAWSESTQAVGLKMPPARCSLAWALEVPEALTGPTFLLALSRLEDLRARRLHDVLGGGNDNTQDRLVSRTGERLLQVRDLEFHRVSRTGQGYFGAAYADTPIGPTQVRTLDIDRTLEFLADGLLEAAAFARVCPQPTGILALRATWTDLMDRRAYRGSRSRQMGAPSHRQTLTTRVMCTPEAIEQDPAAVLEEIFLPLAATFDLVGQPRSLFNKVTATARQRWSEN